MYVRYVSGMGRRWTILPGQVGLSGLFGFGCCTVDCVLQSSHKMRDHRISIKRPRGQTQAFGALGNRRVIDWLDIDAVFVEQKPTNAGTGSRIANHDRYDMVWAVEKIYAGGA